MIHVTNWKYADIGTGVAAADMDQGTICLVSNSSGKRLLTPVLDTDDANTLAGVYCIAMKIGTDADQVDSSTANVTVTGDRTVNIKANDVIMEVRRGAKVEYSADLLDDTLNPAQGGTTPVAGATLGILGGKWCAVGSNALTGVRIGVVDHVRGTNVVVELL